jgi:hypothetical protein
MRISLIALAIGAASPLAAQSRIPGVVSPPASVHLTSSERTLTITSYGEQLATPLMELERINCHLESSAGNVWVVACGNEDSPSGKARMFAFVTNRRDGSSCELTVRFLRETAKWDVEIAPRLAARCAHRWVDDDHFEMTPE